MTRQHCLHIVGMIALVMLLDLAITQDYEIQLYTFKCLNCSKDNKLMCYDNITCNATKKEKYCYHYKYKVETDEIAADYNSRAWGCTESEETCKRGCLEDSNCTDHKCCYADVDFENNPTLNLTKYRECIYGRSGARGLVVVTGLWGAGMAMTFLTKNLIWI